MDQEKALQVMKSGCNTFLTGSAGAGKTHVINQYISYLRDRGVAVAVTASTGIAATHLNGTTIHSWTGIGVKDALPDKTLKAMREKKYLSSNLENVKVLVIDEISMLHARQLDLVNKVLKYFKENEEPFGGIQVVFSGDFFQLPPVGKSEETNREKFAFMSQAWVEAGPSVCYLTDQYRQSNDVLTDILNQIRAGKVSRDILTILHHKCKSEADNSFEITRLYSHNADVDRINTEQLAKLGSESRTFTAEVKGNKKLLELLKKSVLTSNELELKIGAKVMFIKNNLEKGYMNGTLGEVVKYDEEEGLPIVKTRLGKRIFVEPESWTMENEKGKSMAAFIQIPLRLAWAITVHKSQGMTLEAAVVDLRKTFEPGQGYVALSRLRSLSGLHLVGLNDIALKVDKLVMKADVRFQHLSNEVTVPENLQDTADAFIVKCGGITNPDEIRKAGRKKKDRKKKESTYAITKSLIDNGLSIQEMMHERGLARTTIVGHLTKIVEQYPDVNIDYLRPEGDLINKVQKAYTDIMAKDNKTDQYINGHLGLKSLFNQLGGKVGYEDIKLAMPFLKKSD